MLPSRLLLAWIVALAASGVSAQVPSAWEAVGEGFVTDSDHPWRPGHVQTWPIRVTVALDEATGEGRIRIVSKGASDDSATVLYWRRGRLFQSSGGRDDRPAEPVSDLAPATLAMLHPGLLQALVRERPENVHRAVEGSARGGATAPLLIAGGDALWQAETRSSATAAAPDAAPSISALSRRLHHEVFGAMVETVRYDGRTVTVTRGGQVTARLEYAAAMPGKAARPPRADERRDAFVVVPVEEFSFRDLGGGLFVSDIERLNARVFVVEFERDLLVFEGSFSSRNTETLAAAVRARFNKPVRYFAFSHIHPQYMAGVRGWSAAGATVLVPPASVPAVGAALRAPFDLRPDAWSRAAGPERIDPVAERWRREDASAAVVIMNNRNNEHTDDYLMVYLPRIKVLLTGDLLFYRPGRPLRGRSLTLTRTVRELGLEVERYLTTWPLDWEGRNDISAAELRSAAEAGEQAAAAPRS